MNRELTVPHTVVLPIELYPPLYIHIYINSYVEVIRTPMSKYQKFMTYLLVYNIFKCIYLIIIWVVRLEPT